MAGAGFDFVGFRCLAALAVVSGELFPCFWTIRVDGGGAFQSGGGSLVLTDA